MEDFARALDLEPRLRGKLGLEKIPGLAPWLAKAGLDAREAEVHAWCEEKSVRSLESAQERMELRC